MASVLRSPLFSTSLPPFPSLSVVPTTRQRLVVKSALSLSSWKSSTRRQPLLISGLWSDTRQACSERVLRT